MDNFRGDGCGYRPLQRPYGSPRRTARFAGIGITAPRLRAFAELREAADLFARSGRSFYPGQKIVGLLIINLECKPVVGSHAPNELKGYRTDFRQLDLPVLIDKIRQHGASDLDSRTAGRNIEDLCLCLNFVAEDLAGDVCAHAARFSHLYFCDPSHYGRPPFNQKFAFEQFGYRKDVEGKGFKLS